MTGYEIRPYRPGDERALVDTFNLVFGENDPAFVPRTMADWEWSYTRNPAGMRLWVATHDGEIVAQYGSQPSRVWIDGEESVFSQIIDSMVHPRHRRGLKRPGLFVQTAHRMLEATCGVDRDLVTYGWPTPQAWRIGHAFLGYEVVRTQNFVCRSLDDGGPRELPPEVHEIESFDHQARWLYDRCAGDWGASIVRDEHFLDWRFLRHPRVRYRILGVSDAEGLLRGYAVCRPAPIPIETSVVVMDWLVPPDEPEVGRLLEAAVLSVGRAAGASQVLAIFPEWSPWFARFQEWSWLVHPSDYLMSGRNNHPRHDMYWLRSHWWYQLAEMDLL